MWFVLLRIHKVPLPVSEDDAVLDELVSKLRDGDYTPAPGGGFFHNPADSQTLIPSVLPWGSDTRGWELQVLQCPGHTVDSISLVFPARCSRATPSSGRALPSLRILGDYLASLQKMPDASYIRKNQSWTWTCRF